MIKSTVKWHSLVQNGASLSCTQAGGSALRGSVLMRSTGSASNITKNLFSLLFTSCNKKEIWYASNCSITMSYIYTDMIADSPSNIV